MRTLFPYTTLFRSLTLSAGRIDSGHIENLQKVVFGALIILFLIKEPEGLNRLWQRTFSRRIKQWAPSRS